MRFTTSRLALRTLEPGEKDLLSDFLQRNAEFFRPWEPLRDRAYFNQDIRVPDPDREINLAIVENYLPAPGPIVGTIGISNIVRGPFLSAFLGYKLDKEFQGRGYMTEALETIIPWTFSDLGLHRLEANVMPRNFRSSNLLKGLGFVCEGLSPNYLKIAGRWEDHEHWVLRNLELEKE
ncbi:MAG: GNAT family N-acetyltransferase [Spirochaetales bacterium]|nr:GNAT family N-acetyltransferase [Spirochaetales bacterium]